MKKIWLIILIVLFPLNVFAFSKSLILGGDSLGIKVNLDKVLVVGFYETDNSSNDSFLSKGDYIIKVNGSDVTSTEDFIKLINDNAYDNKVDITYVHDNNILDGTLLLSYEEGAYKTGLYVKDSIVGCGTLTFIDPDTMKYGALGHEVAESNTMKTVDVSSGNIYENSIIGIDKSRSGEAGSKISKIFYDRVLGDIVKGSNHGLYGVLDHSLTDKVFIEATDDVRLGKAYIYTSIDDDKIGKYEIKITKINNDKDIKNFNIEVTDKALISKTGGIVQGMSGSPIVQDGKLVGALTHVVVDNPTFGYGLIISKMYDELAF